MRDTRPDCSNFDYLSKCYDCETPLIGPSCPRCSCEDARWCGFARGVVFSVGVAVSGWGLVMLVAYVHGYHNIFLKFTP